MTSSLPSELPSSSDAARAPATIGGQERASATGDRVSVPLQREIGRFERLGEASPGSESATVVVIAALHANEPAGIEAAGRVLAALRAAGPSGFSGRLIALRGNTRALAAVDGAVGANWVGPIGTPARYIDADLNRMFTDGQLERAAQRVRSGNAHAEEHEAYELSNMLAELSATAPGPVAVLDLHTTSSPSPGFIAYEDSLVARAFCDRFLLPRVLGFEEELPGLLINWVTNRLGHVACVIESGQHNDPAAVDGHEAAIWLALDALGVLPLGAADHPCRLDVIGVLRAAAGEQAGRIYDVRRVVPVPSPLYRIDDSVVSFGRLRNRKTRVATEGGVLHLAAESGLMFMPNRQPERRAGDDAYFIVREVGPVWLALSAWIRRWRWFHRRVVPMFPGVRAAPDDPDAVYVEPRVALVLRRQVFHLLGYRIIEHGSERTLSRGRRLLTAAQLLGIGAVGIFLGACRRVLRLGRMPEPKPRMPSDWVARRHRLDAHPPAGNRPS